MPNSTALKIDLNPQKREVLTHSVRSHLLQSWPKKFFLGCVIPPAGAVARSRNLGQTLFANSVVARMFFRGCKAFNVADYGLDLETFHLFLPCIPSDPAPFALAPRPPQLRLISPFQESKLNFPFTTFKSAFAVLADFPSCLASAFYTTAPSLKLIHKLRLLHCERTRQVLGQFQNIVNCDYRLILKNPFITNKKNRFMIQN